MAHANAADSQYIQISVDINIDIILKLTSLTKMSTAAAKKKPFRERTGSC